MKTFYLNEYSKCDHRKDSDSNSKSFDISSCSERRPTSNPASGLSGTGVDRSLEMPKFLRSWIGRVTATVGLLLFILGAYMTDRLY
jgi:hypothetical protein